MSSSLLRFLFSLTITLSMAFWEAVKPFRKPTGSNKSRISANLSLLVINSIAMSLFYFLAPIFASEWAKSNEIGILNQLDAPLWVNILVTVVAFDLLVYFQHRIFHTLPLLWQLHGLHHSDPQLDFSSGGRFHTLEIFLSLLIKSLFVLVLGSSVASIIAFEVILNGMATFNHSNIVFSKKTERLLRLIFVTPEMHRIHHSTELNETNSNFGFNFSLWDRLFKTYIDEPRLGDENVILGLNCINDSKPPTSNIIWMLKSPFKVNFRDSSKN